MHALQNEGEDQLVELSEGWLSHISTRCINTIPSFILCLDGNLQQEKGERTSKTRLTSKDKSCLAVLWRASKSKGKCSLSNSEIVRRSGLNCSNDGIQRTLQRLENFGFIKRIGNHRKRTIKFLVPTPIEKTKRLNLVIPDEINKNPNLTPTQKILATAYIAFNDVLQKKKENHLKWLAKRCGMSVWATRYNLKKLAIFTSKNPPLNQIKPPTKSRSLIIVEFVESRGEKFSKENLNSSECSDDKKINENIPMEGVMNYSEYLINGKKHVPTRHKPIPKTIKLELEEEVFQHKYIRKHKMNEYMSRAARVVSALKRKGGLTNILDKVKIEQIVLQLSNGPNQLNPIDIRAVLEKKFNDEERVELYERLSNSMSPEYGGPGKTIALYDAVWSDWTPGFCRLVKVWLKPPVPKKTEKLAPRVNSELVEPMRLMKVFIPSLSSNAYDIKVVHELKKYHEDTILPKLEKMEITDGKSFPLWLREYLQFANKIADDKNEKLHIGWVRAGSITFLEWEREYNSRAVERWKTAGKGEMIRQAFESREKEEYEKEFRREHGI